MEERSKVSSFDMNAYLKSLKQNGKFTEDMLSLVEADLRFGLTIEETKEYTLKKYDYRQMKVYSKCLRNGYDSDQISVIAADGADGEQMAVALEFYEKGVPLSVIKEVIVNRDNTAYAMKRAFQSVIVKAAETEQISPPDMEYAKELVAQIGELVEKIQFQEKRYDSMNEKLKEIQVIQADKAVENRMLKKLSDCEKQLEEQQNHLNEERVHNVRLKRELEQVKKEKESLDWKAEQMKKEAEKKEEQPMKMETAAKEQAGGTAAIQNSASYKGMTWQTALVDENGAVVSFAPTERMHGRKETPLLTGIFSRILYKKKLDVLKLVAEKNLEPGQMVQVRKGIERGLDEGQLLTLINSGLVPEQMEELILIAEYENRQKKKENA